MDKNYKLEAKPSFWHVKLFRGCYSDYSEDHLFFRANSPDEAWAYLCGVKGSEPLDCWGGNLALKWCGEKWVHPKCTKEDINWDIDYGDTWGVDIEQLKVYEFQKLI